MLVLSVSGAKVVRGQKASLRVPKELCTNLLCLCLCSVVSDSWWILWTGFQQFLCLQIFQARIPESIAIFQGFSHSGIAASLSLLHRKWTFYHWATWEVPHTLLYRGIKSHPRLCQHPCRRKSRAVSEVDMALLLLLLFLYISSLVTKGILDLNQYFQLPLWVIFKCNNIWKLLLHKICQGTSL